MAKNIVQGSLITTFRCNAKCNMCNIWKHQTRPEEEIDASYYEKLPAGASNKYHWWRMHHPQGHR